MSNLYPDFIPHTDGHPTTEDFAVVDSKSEMGSGIIAKRDFNVGDVISVFSGVLTTEITLHSLQVNQDTHLHDPWFIGMLLHSCEPNTILFMSQGRAICQKAIKKGDWLTMDYDTTEATLFRSFNCECGSPICRGRISGYRKGK